MISKSMRRRVGSQQEIFNEGYFEPIWERQEAFQSDLFEPYLDRKIRLDSDSFVNGYFKDYFFSKMLESINDPVFGDVGWLGFNLDENKILYAIDGKAILN